MKAALQLAVTLLWAVILAASIRAQLRKAVDAAYSVGRHTITTDDWCDSW